MIKSLFYQTVIGISLIGIVILGVNTTVYSQYIECGEFHYKVDKPPTKKFITYEYKHLIGIVDTNVMSDRYTKRVIIVNKKSYDILLKYLRKMPPGVSASIDKEKYKYIKVFGSTKSSNSHELSFSDYSLYIRGLLKYIKGDTDINDKDKYKLTFAF